MNLLMFLFPFYFNASDTHSAPVKKDLVLFQPVIMIQDTITFTLSWDFNGDCGKDCHKFIGTGKITAINGKPIGNNCHHLFVKCPSALNLVKDKTYKFIAVPFKPTDCSTPIDTCNDSKFYLLVSAVE